MGYYNKEGIIEAWRRGANPKLDMAMRAKEMNDALMGILSPAQPAGQNSEGGGLFRSFTHDERDDRIRRISGQENPSYLQAVQDARVDNPYGEVFGEAGQAPPQNAKPVDLNERWQRIQQMLQSGDPLLQKSAMESIPGELLPQPGTPSKPVLKAINLPDGYARQGWYVDDKLVRWEGEPYKRRKLNTEVNVNGPKPFNYQAYESSMDHANKAAKAEALLQSISSFSDKDKWEVGAGGWAANKVRTFFGIENTSDIARRELEGLLNLGVLAYLPAGPASDKDVRFAKKGVPWAYSSKENMEHYLRASIKLNKANAHLQSLIASGIPAAELKAGMERWFADNGNIFEPVTDDEFKALESGRSQAGQAGQAGGEEKASEWYDAEGNLRTGNGPR